MSERIYIGQDVVCSGYDATDGYDGSTTFITDTYSTTAGQAMNFFVVTKIDGHTVDDSRDATARLNKGRGAVILFPMAISHKLPTRPLKITIEGQTYYGAPIFSLLNKVYHVSGDVELTAEAGTTYYVKGILSDGGSSVWIENNRGEIEGKKFQIGDGGAAAAALERPPVTLIGRPPLQNP